MHRSVIHIITTILIVAFAAQFANAQQDSAPIPVTITITFDTPPTPSSIVVEQAPLKYNKDFALSMQIDDSGEDIYDIGLPVFAGGYYGNNTYSGFFYSDGCGNLHSFKMSAAVFIYDSWTLNGIDKDVLNPNNNFPYKLHWNELNILYQNGWGVQNHGINGGGNEVNYSVKRNRSYIRRNLFNSTEGGVISRSLVNPKNIPAFTQVAFNYGYINAINQQGTSPIGIDGGGDVNNPSVDWTIPQEIGRKNASYASSLADAMANASTGGANYWGTVFTHNLSGKSGGISFNVFETNFAYISNTYGINGLDNILMTTDEEIQDYLIVRDATDINTTLSGSALEITFTGNVPEDLLFYSSTILVNSDANINSIILSGDDFHSDSILNNTNALINFDWDGYYVIPPEVLADSMTTIASTTQHQYDCWIAMDYVITMENSHHKDSLRQVLCDIPNVTYDDGFCNCEISLQQDIVTIAEDDCTDLFGPVGNYTYEWSVVDSVIVGYDQDYYACPDDTTQYVLTATNTYGCPAEDTITIDIHYLNINIGEDFDICKGDSTTLQGPDDMVQYQWYIDNIPDTNTQNISICPNNTCTYRLEVTDDFNLSDEDTVVVAVNLLPEVSIQSNFTAIHYPECDTLYYSGPPNMDTIMWYENGQYVSSFDTLHICPTNTSEYILVGTSPDGCYASDTLSVNVQFLTVNLGSDTAICLGECVFLEGPPDMVMYIWSKDGVPIPETGQSIYACPTDTSQYSLFVMDQFGITDSDTIQINVWPIPTVDLGPDTTTILLGDTIDLIGAVDAVSWEWYKGSDLFATIQDTADWPTDTVQYKHIATNTFGCRAKDSILVNVHSFTFTLGPDTSICEGSCDTLIGPMNMTNYRWFEADTLLLQSDTTYSIVVCPPDTTEYILIVQDSLNYSTSDTIVLNVIPAPEVFVLPTNPTINYGDSVELYGPDTTIYSYEWFMGDSLLPDTSFSIYASPEDTTLYTLIVTDTSTDCSAEDTTWVYVNHLSFDLGPNDTICQYDCRTITGPPDMVIYEWWVADTLYANTREIEPCPMYTTMYTLWVENDVGATAEDSIIINVLPSPIIEFEYDTLNTCYGNDLEVTLTVSSDVETYEWYFLTYDTITTTNTITIPDIMTSGELKVYANGENGCQTLATTYINMNFYPQMNVISDTLVCGSDSVELYMSGGTIFYWIVAEDTISTNPTIYVTPTETTDYIATTAFDDLLCFSSDTVTVQVFDAAYTKINYDTNHVCKYETFELSGEGADNYLWMPGEELSDTIYVTITDTTTYMLTGSTTDGCVAYDTVTFYPREVPEVSFTGLLPAFCITDPLVELIGSPLSGNFSGDGILDGFFVPGATTPGIQEVYYSYRVDENSCYGIDTNTTIVYDNDGVIDLGSSFSLTLYDSATLDAGAGFNNYLWTTGATSQSIIIYGTDKPTGTYEYAVIGIIGGCSTRGSVHITFGAEGYSDEFVKDLVIYPNPNTGKFVVKFSTTEEELLLKVTNLQGKTVYENDDILCQKDCITTVELDGIPQGIYILQIITPKGISTTKVVLK